MISDDGDGRYSLTWSSYLDIGTTWGEQADVLFSSTLAVSIGANGLIDFPFLDMLEAGYCMSFGTVQLY